MSRNDDDRYGEQRHGQRYDDPYDERHVDNDDSDDYDDYDEYDVVEEESPGVRRARARRRKALITVAVVLLGLFFAFWWAWSYYQVGSSTKATPTTSATCQADGPSVIVPSKITVNVFNSTTRAGLAKSASEELRAQGYAIGQVANDPQKKQVAGPAEVRFGPAGKARADLVLTSIGEGAVAVPDERADASVDVALGQAFVKMQPVALPAGTLPLCPAPSSPAPASPSPAAS